jgi:hypothetical protein
VDRCAAPAVAGRAFDADLHRPGRAEAVLATVHAGQAGLAVVALHRADAGQDRPRHAVLLPDLLVPEEEVRRDRLGLGAGRRLPGGAGLLPEQPALAAKNAFVPTRMGTASRPRPTTASSPMMPTTRIRGARCCLVELGWVVSVRIRSLFVMTAPRWTARCR